MPPYPYQLRTPWGSLIGERLRLGNLFWQLSDDELVRLLTGMGYSEKAARAEVQKFSHYKRSVINAQPELEEQDSSDEPDSSGSPVFDAWQKLLRKRGEA